MAEDECTTARCACDDNKVLNSDNGAVECENGWELELTIKTHDIGPGGIDEEQVSDAVIRPVVDDLFRGGVLLNVRQDQQFDLFYRGSGIWHIRLAFLLAQYNVSTTGIQRIHDIVLKTALGVNVFLTELPSLENMAESRTTHVAFRVQGGVDVHTEHSRGFQIVDSSYVPGKYILVLDIGMHARGGFVLIMNKNAPGLLAADQDCARGPATAGALEACCRGYLARRFVTTQAFHAETFDCSQAGGEHGDIATHNFVSGGLHDFDLSYADLADGKITLHLFEFDMDNTTVQRSRVGATEVLELQIGFAFLTADTGGGFSWSTVLVNHRLEKTLYSTVTSQVQSDSILVVGQDVSLFRSFLPAPTAALFDFADVHLHALDENSTAHYEIEPKSVRTGVGTTQNTTKMHPSCDAWEREVGSIFAQGVQVAHGDCQYTDEVCTPGRVRGGLGQGMIMSLGEGTLSEALEKSAFKIEASMYLFLDFYVNFVEQGTIQQKRVRSFHLITWERTRVDCANEHELLGVVGVETILGLHPNVSRGTNVSGFNDTRQCAPVATLRSTVLPDLFLQRGNEDYFVRMHRLFAVHVSSRIKREEIDKVIATRGLVRQKADLAFDITQDVLDLCPYWFSESDAGSGCQTHVVLHNGVLNPHEDRARELSAAPQALAGTWSDMEDGFKHHAQHVLELQYFDRRLQTAWVLSTKNAMNDDMRLHARRGASEIPSSDIILLGSFRLMREGDACPASDYELTFFLDLPVGLVDVGHSAHIRTAVERVYTDVLGAPSSCAAMDGFRQCHLNGTLRACTAVRLRLPYLYSNVSDYWSAQIVAAALDGGSSLNARLQYLQRSYLSAFVNDTRWEPITGANASLRHIRHDGDDTRPRNSAAFTYLIRANDVPVSDQAVQFFADNMTFGKNARMTELKVAAPNDVLCGSPEVQKQFLKERIETPLIFSSANTLREIVIAHVGIDAETRAFCAGRRRLLQFTAFLLDSEVVFIPVREDVTVVITGVNFLYDSGVRFLKSEDTKLLPAIDVFRGMGWLADGTLVPPTKPATEPMRVLLAKRLIWLDGVAWTGVVLYAIMLILYFMLLTPVLYASGVGIMDNVYFWDDMSDAVTAGYRPPQYEPAVAYQPWPYCYSYAPPGTRWQSTREW